CFWLAAVGLGAFTAKAATKVWIGDNAQVCITSGGQFLPDGHTETIGSLCLTNSFGDTESSLVDTGGATLSVQGDITAVNEAAEVVPTIRGLLGFPGAAAANGAKKAAITQAPRQGNISDSSTPLRPNDSYSHTM